MSVFWSIVTHPANRSSRGWAARKWITHNIRRRLRRNADISVPIDGSLLRGPANHPVVCLVSYTRGGRYDFETMWAIEHLAPRFNAFVDVGASIGGHSLVASYYLPWDGRVIAIEPEEDERRWLKGNLTQIPQEVTIIDGVVSDVDSEVMFQSDESTLGRISSLGTPIRSWRLTTVLDALSIRSALIKVDVEGWEPAVLAGAADWLRRSAAAMIVEAKGLQDRSSTSWCVAVDIAYQVGLTFVWPDIESRSIVVARNPPRVAPIGDYVLIPEADIRDLDLAWKAYLTGRSASTHGG